MTPYRDDPRAADDAAELERAMEALDAFRAKYGHLIKLDVLTLTDISHVVMDDYRGQVMARNIYSRDELLAGLECAANSPGADLEHALYQGVQEYRETLRTRSEQ